MVTKDDREVNKSVKNTVKDKEKSDNNDAESELCLPLNHPLLRKKQVVTPIVYIQMRKYNFYMWLVGLLRAKIVHLLYRALNTARIYSLGLQELITTNIGLTG